MKITLSFVLNLLLLTICNSQNLTLSFGVKQIESESGEIQFGYIDESPVPDEFITDFEITSAKQAVSLAGEFDWYNESSIYAIGRLQGFVGPMNGVDLGLGAGYAIKLNNQSTIRLQPEILAVLGYASKSLGELIVQNNGSVYITVNETQFDNYENVGVTLQKTYLTIKPGISLAIGLKSGNEIKLQVSYQFFGDKGMVAFDGPVNGEEVSEMEEIGVSNMYFYLDGITSYDIPFKPKGFELRLGYSFMN